MKIAKFGGTSVGSPEAIGALVGIVLERKDISALVVSAFSGATDELIAIGRSAAAGESDWRSRLDALDERHRRSAIASGRVIKEKTLRSLDTILAELGALLSGVALIGEISPRSLDLVMSFGERLSAIVVTAALNAAGRPAEAVDARKIVIAEGDFGAARPIQPETATAAKALLGPLSARGILPVVTGFIASTLRGETVTLGRGGSDYTAAVLGAVMGADEVEIWTDVNGVLTADPHKVKDAFSLESLSFEEAAELSHFGAKILYPPTIQPALERGIPIRVLNTFDPTFVGTVISPSPVPSRYPVRAISSVPEASLLRLQGPGMVGVTGIATRLFGCLARRKINIILISQASSERSICLAIEPRDRQAAISAIAEEFAVETADGRIDKPVVEDGKAILAIVGAGMQRTPGISGKVFQALGRHGVNVSAIAQGSSELNISTVVDSADEARALAAVHEAFFLTGTRSANVVLVGCGLVGGTLLDQIRRHQTVLSEEYSVRINVVGISDSKRMLLSSGGIGLETWRERLLSEGEKTDLAGLVERARGMNLPNTVFVDCTASQSVPLLYPAILRSSIAIVTPNKKGNAASMGFWREIREASRQTGTPYLYETTAGAGLPVISTLHDLQVSGDRIVRIDAMLSGTIGHVISNYLGDRTFASLVREAKELGYTEPDPRDDLCAADCARKALILAREAGYALEFEDVSIEPLVPPECLAAGSVEDFLSALEVAEPWFRDLRDRAEKTGGRLVYAATIDDDGIRLAFRHTMSGDPLHDLRGAENAVAFTTERYATMSLVVRGPGAGGEVTAGGLFADIVRVAKSLV